MSSFAEHKYLQRRSGAEKAHAAIRIDSNGKASVRPSANYNGTSYSVTAQVIPATIYQTSTSLIANAATYTENDPVILTAQISGNGGTLLPTGLVTLYDGGIGISNAILDATGVAHFSLSGQHKRAWCPCLVSGPTFQHFISQPQPDRTRQHRAHRPSEWHQPHR